MPDVPHFSAPWKLLKALCDALEIAGPVQRLVLDVSVKGVPTVYVQRLVFDAAQGEAAARALADAAVAADCVVMEAERLAVGEKGEPLPGGRVRVTNRTAAPVVAEVRARETGL
jgi:hypothetical protein